MRVKLKLFKGIVAVSCIGVLMVSYAGSTTLLRTRASRFFTPAAALDSNDLKYPIQERTTDHVTGQPNDPFYLKDPPAIVETVDYDPASGMYVVTETVAGQNVRPPMYMTFEDYMAYTERKERDEYWKSRANAINLVEEKNLIPPIQVKKQFFDKLFGSSKIEIKPQGNVEVTLGGNTQFTNNPNIPLRNRKTGGFDFDMNINMNVIGKIGDKLQLGVKYNTQSGFEFDNQVKLGYTGDEDDIIKVIEAGNVSLPLNTRLISGSQTLFGLKTQFQFGRLTWTSVVSQQKAKKETITVEQGGTQRQTYEVKADQYEENRHFFMSQFFRNQYDYALSGLPNIKSVMNITRLEVWVTNRTGVTQNVRDVVAFQDLGESAPYSTSLTSNGGDTRTRNDANDLYAKLTSNPTYRFVDNVVATMQSAELNLRQGQDFEKTYARKLAENEYSYNRQLGFISLNTTLNPNEVLGVAFQYEYNGQVFQVGEFANQVPPDSNATSKVLFLKMLRGAGVRPLLPIWNLMMKNVYSIGAFQLSNEDFRFDIYYNDPGGGYKRYMPQGCLQGKPLISILNLDNLNLNGDPQPDGLFDFVPGVTVLTQNGRIIFPVKEPFGDNLRSQFNACGSGTLANSYVYDQLYDSTRFIAQQFPEYNRFVMKGQYRGTNNRDISLGTGNIPRGSVVVTAGGQKLVENTHYTVDYNLGRLTILDQGILNSGQQIKVDFENNNLFATQVRTMFGTRLDYKVNNKLNIGGTVMHLRERPYTQKVNIGEDPIRNTIMGLDVKYESNMPWLTKALDRLPVYSTKEMSTISTYAEVAYLKPGHSKAINNQDKDGQVYIDDFEGTSNGYDLKQPSTAWKLASTPRNSPGPDGKDMFPEATRINDSTYGYNRAKLAWYRIDNSFFNPQASPGVVYNNKPLLTNHYVRLIPTQEIFPNRPNQNIDQNIYTFDLSYYPKERGPYNFEFSSNPTPGVSAGIDNDGQLKAPEKRWGGIMRSIENNDLEANNVEFIEFWMMDPFIYNTTSPGGKLYFNLGNISEDILRDSRMQFENGLSSDRSTLDSTNWGFVPRLPPLVNAFDNDANQRPVQDVGFDGLDNAAEVIRKSNFLANINNNPNLTQAVKDKLNADPSSDNYRFFNDGSYDAEPNILTRYKDYDNPEGNSPVQSGNSALSTAGTNLPDAEDLNRDNSLNENEEYFQYEVPMFPGMDVGNNPYIVSKVANDAATFEGVQQPAYTWYQFRVPIREYSTRVGSIPDFKSIQFMRMFMTGWSDSAVLRFGTLELVRNQWRTYNLNLDETCEQGPKPDDQTSFFNVASVSIEENSAKKPVNYVLPPDIEREQALGSQTNQFVQQNEQSLSINACNLTDCKTRAVFKNLTLDVRRYKRLRMFIHANAVEGELPVRDNEITAVLRIGSDFKDNYYQYEVPLKITPNGTYVSDNEADRKEVWPETNSIDVTLQDFINLKQQRNTTDGYPRNVPFVSRDAAGRLISIVGNPDIGDVKTIMLGIRNPSKFDENNPLLVDGENGDDGQTKCVEVWFNELRLTGFQEFGGAAAVGSIAIKLADLGNINLSGGMHTVGFGQIEQKIDQRFKDNFYQYDFSSAIDAGKFFPVKLGLRLPFYGSYAQTFSTPEFDPYQFDIPTKTYIKTLKTAEGKDSARHYLQQIQTINTRRGYNFSNVRIVPQTKAKRPHIYDPGNWNFTYAYTEQLFSDPYTEKNSRKNWLGIIGWNFAPQSKDFTPLKKAIKSKSKWLDLFRDFNFNPYPSNLSVTSEWTRDFVEIKLRPLGEVDFIIPPTYSKNFRWNRTYGFKYNPFKSLSIEYAAVNNGRIDEPDGHIDTKEEKNEVWGNVGKGGRNTNYNQSLGVNYTVPINKLPIFDFITANAGYNSTYTWTALPWQKDSATGILVQNSLGNILNNTQNDRGKVDLNFKKLYDKIPFLKAYNSPNPTVGDKKENDKKREAVKKAREKIKDEIIKLKDRRIKLQEELALAKADTSAKGKQDVKRLKDDLKKNRKAIKAKKQDYANKQPPSNPGISILLRPLLSLKRASVEYKESKSTLLPGFTGYSRLLGVDYKTKSPGYDFAFGRQPGDRLFKTTDSLARSNYLDEAAAKGWITKDTLLNQKFTQSRSQRLDITAQIEPWPDLKIDLNVFRDYTVTHTQLFKYLEDTLGAGFRHLNPVDMGSYSISYLPARTMFAKIDKEGRSKIYSQFEANREIISQRLGTGTYYNPSDTTYNNAYTNGYGPKAQEVLIPAFLAAYTKTDANKIKLNPFKALPLPNWRIAYTGFSKFKWAQKIFTNLTISHGYSSTLTVNSFQTNLQAQTDSASSTGIDPLNGNFYPQYSIPNIVMNEQLSPLIGIDMTFKNNITAKFDYKTSRTMTVNFADYQMIENTSKQFTVGAGYKIKGLKLPIKIKGKKIRLDNDLSFRFDFGYRDNVTVNHRIDESAPQVTQGSTTITIQPAIDYIISKRMNVRLFFDQTRTIPKISSGFPITNTRGGLTFRFSLSE